MGWHDFGNLEGPGWAANAVGGACEIYSLGEFLQKPEWQGKGLAILDHVLDGGFIDEQTGFIRGYRETTTGKFCLNYKHNSDWFCPGSMAKVGFQLPDLRRRVGQRSAGTTHAGGGRRMRRVDPRPRRAGAQRLVSPSHHAGRQSRTGNRPRAATTACWQASADGLFILQLQAALTERGLADYRAPLKKKTAAFIRAGGIFGSINHDTFDAQENVAYAVAFRTLLGVSRLLKDEALRDVRLRQMPGGTRPVQDATTTATAWRPRGCYAWRSRGTPPTCGRTPRRRWPTSRPRPTPASATRRKAASTKSTAWSSSAPSPSTTMGRTAS